MAVKSKLISLSAAAVDGHCPTLDFFSKIFLTISNVDAWSDPELELELHGVNILLAWLVQRVARPRLEFPDQD